MEDKSENMERRNRMLSSEMVFWPPAELETMELDGTTVLLDSRGPNWIATDEAGKKILRLFDGEKTFNDVVRAYVADTGFEMAKAWQHVETVTRDAIRQKFLVKEPVEDTQYAGREKYLETEVLSELWIHTNNSCNLACEHCLVSSGPEGDVGLPAPLLLDIIDQARSLGAKHFFFTGGEPFLRKDIFAIVDHVLADPEAELVILTNGILLTGHLLRELKNRDINRIRLQVSLDGSTADVNDSIRGTGSYDKIIRGITAAVDSGIDIAITTVITRENVHDVPAVTTLIGKLDCRTHHLLWLHKRGRAIEGGFDHTPSVEEVISVVREARQVGRSVRVTVDNGEAIRARLHSGAGTKWDLSKAGVSSLCVYSDGNIYPSAAMANVEELLCGNVREKSLEEIWKKSEVTRAFRGATVLDKEICRKCPFQFICGGGDIEHAYFYGGSIQAHDPYCDLHKAMIADAFRELSEERRDLVSNGKSGYNAPVLFTGMSDGAVCPSADVEPSPVRTTSSECVLAFELDHGRRLVRDFYGEVAETPQKDLCCPVQPEPEDLSHIPAEVVDRFYGCGSPLGSAKREEGEVTIDLGSGAGIDVFIAAKKVGPEGQSIGIDMTDRMLEEARKAQPAVAKNLGYDSVEFRKGYLEEIPVEDKTADLVTSNCVINLSPDKMRVFSEMWRVLKDNGRLVVADIVSEEEVPPKHRQDPRLWGECISGALTEEEFLAYLERSGFYGVQVLKKSFWREVEGYRFYSITVRGYKFEKKEGCVYIGQTAIYQGPFKGILDEEGHWFPRGVPVEICTDTAAKLAKPPYEDNFIVTDPTRSIQEAFSCCDEDSCC
jgi:radical SAM protein with 4Fe4S-binding SPASM domain